MKDWRVRWTVILVVTLIVGIGVAAIARSGRSGQQADSAQAQSVAVQKQADAIQAELDRRNASTNARGCISYGADIVLYNLLLQSPRRPGDDAFRTLLTQSRDAKVSLRSQLNCPPYPPTAAPPPG